MKTPHLLLIAALIFGFGIFTGKTAFREPIREGVNPAPVSQRSLRSGTSRRSSSHDYSAQIANAKNLSRAGDREREMILLLTDMVLTDPAQAIPLLDEIHDDKLGLEFLNEAVAAWILSDPNAAIEWFRNQPSSPFKNKIALTMFNKTLIRNPLVARQVFEAAPSLGTRENMTHLAHAWARSDFEAAKSFVTSQDEPRFKNAGLAAIMGEWGRRDPAAAIAYLKESFPLFEGGHSIAHFELIRGWAEKDPAAAFDFAKGFKPGPAIMGATFFALESWIKDDPQAAVAAMESMSDKVYPSASIVSDWAKIDLDSAKEWLKTYDHKSRYSGMSSLISDLAKKDFKKAAQLYQEFTESSEGPESDPNKSLEGAGRDLARTWARHNPEEAIAWVDSLPTSQSNDSIISSVVSAVGSKIPEKAIELAGSLPLGELRAGTISNLVRNLKNTHHPVQAFEASQLITDDQSRLATTEDLLKRIKVNDHEAALNLLNQAIIPEADRERIRGTLE